MEEKKQEPFDISRLSEKSKKLVEKVDSLTEKIKSEKSPLKKHILAFKVKMLISKIQREIDLHNIKDHYQDLRVSSKEQKERGENASLDNIAQITDKIKSLERELRGNEEYDAESQYFMYPSKFVEQSGGIENFVQRLKQSEKPETKQAAQRIELMAQKRKELEGLYEALEQEQDTLNKGQKDYKKQEIQYNIKEKSMILKQKVNVFSRISNFFKTMGEQAKLYIEEKKQGIELKMQQKEEEDVIKEEYRVRMETLRREMKDAIALSRESATSQKEMNDIFNSQDMADELRDRREETVRTRVKVSQEFLAARAEIDELTSPEAVKEWANRFAAESTLSDEEIDELLYCAEMRKLDLENGLGSENPENVPKGLEHDTETDGRQ